MRSLNPRQAKVSLSGMVVLTAILACGFQFAWSLPVTFAQEELQEELPEPIPTLESDDNADLTSTPQPAEAKSEGDAEAKAPPEKRAAIPQNPKEIVDALGYPFLIPFVLASIISLWFAMERLVILRRGRVIPRPFVERFLQHLTQGQLEPATALQLCDQNGSPVAAVFAHGIRKWGKPSVEVEQAIIDGGERQVSQLRKHLRVLNGVATVTPLIGLLGTVIGMIQAFNQIANSSPDQKAQELAVGIALALLTTAAGLLIAIPSLIMYMYLTGKVDSVVMEMDDLAQNVVHLISAESVNGRLESKSTASNGAKKSGRKKAKAVESS